MCYLTRFLYSSVTDFIIYSPCSFINLTASSSAYYQHAFISMRFCFVKEFLYSFSYFSRLVTSMVIRPDFPDIFESVEHVPLKMLNFLAKIELAPLALSNELQREFIITALLASILVIAVVAAYIDVAIFVVAARITVPYLIDIFVADVVTCELFLDCDEFLLSMDTESSSSSIPPN